MYIEVAFRYCFRGDSLFLGTFLEGIVVFGGKVVLGSILERTLVLETVLGGKVVLGSLL